MNKAPKSLNTDNVILNDIMIRKIWENKTNKQLLVTIPIKSGFKKGDYVSIKKVTEL